jgi:putative hydrolase of the HAD superfamily
MKTAPVVPWAPTFDRQQIRAISFDLDDTLWPVWPTIARAEQVLLDWLKVHAPATAEQYPLPESMRALRDEVQQTRPDLHHDLGGMRREAIRLALCRSGHDQDRSEALTQGAHQVFYNARQQVEFYDDALTALQSLAERYPLVTLSNGNADVHAIGCGHFFQATFSAHLAGCAKPDARFFEMAAASQGLRCEQVLHVGDDAHLDVVGAALAGMPAVWLNRDNRDWPPSAEAALKGAAGATLHRPLVLSNLTQLCDWLSATD